jgi:5-methylcytosine-specific restriction endonuclease McrA
LTPALKTCPDCPTPTGETSKNMDRVRQKGPRLKLSLEEYDRLRKQVLRRHGWRCQECGSSQHLEVHHLVKRSQLGDDEDENLISLCATCHRKRHQV